MIRWLTTTIAIFACAAPAGAQPLDDAALERIAAFVRAAGIVRYFGSPPAGNAEWERFTVAGIARVEQAKTHDDFVEALRTLFAPISSAIVIASPESRLAGPTARRERFVERVRWWRHRGVRTTEQHADFESRVVTRWVPTATASGIGFIAIAFIAFTAVRVRRFRVAIGLLAVALTLSLSGWILWARSAPDPAGVRRFALPGGVWMSIPATIPEDSAPPRIDPQADTRLERLAAVATGWNVLQHFIPMSSTIDAGSMRSALRYARPRPTAPTASSSTRCERWPHHSVTATPLKIPMVWVTSPAAISYAEHCLDAVQHHRLGSILGQRRAAHSAARTRSPCRGGTC